MVFKTKKAPKNKLCAWIESNTDMSQLEIAHALMMTRQLYSAMRRHDVGEMKNWRMQQLRRVFNVPNDVFNTMTACDPKYIARSTKGYNIEKTAAAA